MPDVAASKAAPIRTGLIGFGLAGQVFHEPFLSTNADFRIDLVSTSDPERAAIARAKGYTVVDTPAEVLARAGELDLVVLATPPAVHLEQATAALEAGAAVVVDKPFAASVADAEALIATAQRVGRPLIVFQNRRWDGDFLLIKRLIASGRLGRIHRFESTFERFAGPVRDRWRDRTSVGDGGGITFDLGSHLVDQALQLFGPASLERAEIRTIREGAANDDDSFISLRHDSGVVSHLTMSAVAAQAGPRFRVLGVDGAYTVYGLDGQEPDLKLGKHPGDPGFGVTPEADWGVIGGGVEPLKPIETEHGNYAAFYAGVADSILRGAPVPVDARDSLATLKILEQALAS